MPIYHKLVRDKIPDIIRQNGSIPVTEKLAQEDYLFELRRKLTEEQKELLAETEKEKILEEAADLVEVLHAYLAANGISVTEVEDVRKKKGMERGCFYEKIFLKEVKPCHE